MINNTIEHLDRVHNWRLSLYTNRNRQSDGNLWSVFSSKTKRVLDNVHPAGLFLAPVADFKRQ